MAKKKTTKKTTKKVTKKLPKSTKNTKKENPKEDTFTFKTNHLFIFLMIIALVIAAVFLIPKINFSGSEKAPGITVLNDEECERCNTKEVIGLFSEAFPGIEIRTVDVSSREGKKLLDLGVTALPAYFFDEELENEEIMIEILTQFPETFLKLGDYYQFNPAASGVNKLLIEVNLDERNVLGNPDAPVTIYEFSDFECPFCKRFIDTSYPEIKEKLIDTGKAKLVFVHFPLPSHENALSAAMASECAAYQGKFWEMHDKLFENQASLSVENFKIWAEELGLSTEEFNSCLDNSEPYETIFSDFSRASSYYISGTPSFIIGDEIIVGALPYSEFSKIIG